MPKIVDRDARRREIVETYLALVAREGMEAATTRRLAQELGVATGALWHYFAGFDEVLAAAFELVFERTSARIEEHVGSRTGLAALIASIEQIHPLDKVTHDEANVVVAFWGRAGAHPHHGLRDAYAERSWRDAHRAHLERARADGELHADAPTDALADALLVLALGHQVAFVLDTPLAAGSAQWRAVQTILAPWLTPAGEKAAALAERAR